MEFPDLLLKRGMYSLRQNKGAYFLNASLDISLKNSRDIHFAFPPLYRH